MGNVRYRLRAFPATTSHHSRTGLKDTLKNLGTHIRALGFKGSGQNFRKVIGDYVFVINIQGSRSGDVFYVNLGAQPAFIPAECDASLTTLKEYECVMRKRVGNDWRWTMSPEAFDALIHQLDIEQKEFFGAVAGLGTAMMEDPVNDLLQKFSMGNPPARAALHLARAAAVLGCRDTANALVERGLALAGERATALIHDLEAVGRPLE